MISELFLQDWFSGLKRGKSNGGIRKQKKNTTQNRFAALCAHVTRRPYISWHRLRRLTRASGIFPYRLVVVPVDPSHAVDPHLGDPSHLQGHTQHNSVSHRSHTFKHICTKCCSCPIRVLICNNKISQYKTTEKRRNLYMYVCICIYVYIIHIWKWIFPPFAAENILCILFQRQP